MYWLHGTYWLGCHHHLNRVLTHNNNVSETCCQPYALEASAVALPLAGLTALQALFTKSGRTFTGDNLGDLKAGQKLLVLGGATLAGDVASLPGGVRLVFHGPSYRHLAVVN